jgi:hypothetical protein
VRAEEGGRGKVGSEIKTSRGRPAGLSYIVSSHGSRLQLPGFFGTEGAHQSQIASASASTNRQQEHITPNGDRQTAVSQCANASTCGQTRESKHPLGKLDIGERAQYSGFRLPSPLTWVHVSSGNECGQPHGGQSRASRTAGSKVGVCEVGVDMSQGPSARLCLVAFLVEPRSALHARGRIRVHNTCESA